MKYVIIPLVKLGMLLIAIFFVTPLMAVAFALILFWTLSWKTTVSLGGWPWSEVRIHWTDAQRPMHWHPLYPESTLVYPTQYHAALGWKPEYRAVKELTEEELEELKDIET